MMINNMDKGQRHGKMEIDLKVIMRMGRKEEWENSNGRVETFTLENSRIIKCMEKDCLQINLEQKGKVNGMKEKGLNGKQ